LVARATYRVGAGASAPEKLMQGVTRALQGLGDATVDMRLKE
jgi:4-hydroxy-3-methylbut-2-enyl diphosphate reductase IspH